MTAPFRRESFTLNALNTARLANGETITIALDADVILALTGTRSTETGDQQ